MPKVVPEKMRMVDSLEKLEIDHPPYHEQEIVRRIREYAQTVEYAALCFEGRLREARLKAGSGRYLEEVGTILAVLGEFDAALSVARDSVLDSFRQKGVLSVLVIEMFRRGRAGDASALLSELESRGIGAWDRIQLALGFKGREPWGGFPFSDW